MSTTTIDRFLLRSRSAIEELCTEDTTLAISEAAAALTECLVRGGKVLTCGNGGSAADAQHFAAELVGLYTEPRRPLAAVALTTDSSVLTAVANDFGFSHLFARQVEALGRPGDALIALSGSGNSANVIAAAEAARRSGIHVVGIVGPAPSGLDAVSHSVIRGRGPNTSIVQQTHIAIIHALCEEIERVLAVGAFAGAEEGAP